MQSVLTAYRVMSGIIVAKAANCHRVSWLRVKHQNSTGQQEKNK
jgi:hypothetical protein